MISTKLLNIALDSIQNANPVAELSENLAHQGVTEAMLAAALNGRHDGVAQELRAMHSNTVKGVPATNKYGVTRTARVKSTAPKQKAHAMITKEKLAEIEAEIRRAPLDQVHAVLAKHVDAYRASQQPAPPAQPIVPLIGPQGR